MDGPADNGTGPPDLLLAFPQAALPYQDEASPITPVLPLG